MVTSIIKSNYENNLTQCILKVLSGAIKAMQYLSGSVFLI